MERMNYNMNKTLYIYSIYKKNQAPYQPHTWDFKKRLLNVQTLWMLVTDKETNNKRAHRQTNKIRNTQHYLAI